MLIKKNTRYKTLEKVTPSIYRTKNFDIINSMCRRCQEGRFHSLVFSSPGHGKSTALTNFCLSRKHTFYTKLKAVNDIDVHLFVKQVAEALLPDHGALTIDHLYSIVNALDSRKITLLVIDNFQFNADLICAASLLCEALKGRTGIVFSLDSTIDEWRSIFRQNGTMNKFLTGHISVSSVLYPPREFEVRTICLDRGITTWTQFKRHQTIMDLNNAIEDYLQRKINL